MKKIFILLILLVSAVGAHAQSKATAPITDVEFQSLPAYCKGRLKGGTAAEKAPYEAQLGVNNFLHIHHYCIAMNIVNRLRSVVNRQERGTMMSEAIANYEYTINASEKTFWLLPQMRVEAGRMYLQIGKKGEAVQHFTRAISANPAYMPAYMPLIEVYKELGSSQSALEVATSGLRQFPDSKPLQKAYIGLGGKLPYPEPVSRAGATPQSSGDDPTHSRADGAVGQGGADSQKSNESAGAAMSATPAEPAQGVIGGCRFCPPEEIQKKWRESFGEPSKQ